MNDGDVIVTFHTTHDSLACERRLRASLPPVRLISTPRPISSECGFTLLCSGRLPAAIEAFLLENAMKWEAIYRVRREGRRFDYERIERKED